jgi:VIT1/CCC1 family predicted Fe2+/Mn2+ transporter
MNNLIHEEKHFTGGKTVRDVVIGMADGLTVPFALAAGLTGAITSSHLIVIAGLAEIVAGSIAMGLGGYLAAKSEHEHYASEERREEREIIELPEVEAQEVMEIFKTYGLSEEESGVIVNALKKRPGDWVNFMMKFELGLEKPDPKRAHQSALTIAGSYVVGGLIPLAPYFFISQTRPALFLSVLLTMAALATFGFIKGIYTGTPAGRSAGQTLLIGGLAAMAAFLIARFFS